MIQCISCKSKNTVYARERAYVDIKIGGDGKPIYPETIKPGDNLYYDDGCDLYYFCTSCGAEEEDPERVFIVLENSVDFIIND